MRKRSGIKGLYLKRGWYYYQPPTPKSGGPRPRAVALETRDLATALLTLEEKRTEVEQWQAARRMTLEEVLPLYYASKKADSILTRRQREIVLDGFSRILKNPRVDQVTTAMVESWRDHVEKHGTGKKQIPDQQADKRKAKEHRSPTTVKTYMIVVRAFFHWAVEQKMIKESPMKKMKRQVKVAKTRRQEFLTEEQRDILLAADAPDHVRFILHFGFLAGLRCGEMLAMTDRWLWMAEDGSRGTVTVQNQKITRTDGSTGEWKPKVREIRTIPLHPRIVEFLKGYGMKAPWMLRPDKPLWPTDSTQSKRYDATKALHTLAKTHGIPKLNYHILRHSFATHLVMKGVSLADVAGLLGDTLQVTEETYAGYSPNHVNPLAVL